MSAAFDLGATYLALDGVGGVTRIPVGPDFWRTIETNPAARGTLVTAGAIKADWAHWEMHPHGDEIVLLLDGDIDFIFETADGEEINPMAPGEAILTPKGVWHRAIVRKPGRVVFVTYGKGTMHKPVAP